MCFGEKQYYKINNIGWKDDYFTNDRVFKGTRFMKANLVSLNKLELRD